MSDHFGLTPQGFTRPRLNDIRNRIAERVRAEVGDISTAPDSVTGQLIGVLAKSYADIWEAAEQVYNSQYPSTADGVSLDNVAQLTGVDRLEARRTTVTATCYGSEGTIIPSGSLARDVETAVLYETTEQRSISRTRAVDIFVEVLSVDDETEYQINVNSQPAVFESGVGASETDILEGLRDAINDLEIDNVTATVEDGEIRIRADDFITPFSVASGDGLSNGRRGSPFDFEAVETGPNTLLEGGLTEIETPVSGWDEVINYVDGVTGRNRESDAELRVRRAASVRVSGASNLEAIRSNLLQEIPEIEVARLFENRSIEEDARGRPSHSFEAVVVGGDDQEIADTLWLLKPAGIETFGNETLLVEDSNGDDQAVSFSRPEPVYVWVRCDVRPKVGNGFPANGSDQVRDAILEFGQNIGIGDKVIIQAFFGAIYEVPGIGEITLTMAVSEDEETEPDSGDFSTDNIEVGQIERANFAEDRIEVTIA